MLLLQYTIGMKLFRNQNPEVNQLRFCVARIMIFSNRLSFERSFVRRYAYKRTMNEKEKTRETESTLAKKRDRGRLVRYSRKWNRN